MEFVLSDIEKRKRLRQKVGSKEIVQGENKSQMLPHLLFYRNVCLGLIRTDNYTCYAQSFEWLPIHPVSKVTFQ
jgi:hypothetical protein